MEITPDNVQSVLGDKFTVREHTGGNVQVQFANLGDVQPYDVCCFLKEAAEKLVAAGLITNPNEAVRLSWNTHKLDEEGNEIWKPYPQLWVNQPTQQAVQTQANTQAITDLKSGQAEIMAALNAMAGKPAAKVEAPVTPPPSESDPF